VSLELAVQPDLHPHDFIVLDMGVPTLCFNRVREWLKTADPEDPETKRWQAYHDTCGGGVPPPTDTPYAAARVYWELFDGLNTGTNGQYVRPFNIDMSVGGYGSDIGFYFQVSVYGRQGVNGDNLEVGSGGHHYFFREVIWRPYSSTEFWRRIRKAITNTNPKVTCIVVKTEAMVLAPGTPDPEGYTWTYADQLGYADVPPWGMKIHSAQLYCTPLNRAITPEKAVGHLVRGVYPGEKFFCPKTSGIALDQLYFKDPEKNIDEAIQDVNKTLGWGYEATPDTFSYLAPETADSIGDEHLYAMSMSDPHVTWNTEPDAMACFNRMRVGYTGVVSKHEKPREVVVNGMSEYLGGGKAEPKEDYQTAPDSIRSAKGAKQYAKVALDAVLEPPITGSFTATGTLPVASGEDRDVLMVKPGEMVLITDAPYPLNRAVEITRVQKNWLEHTAEIELGEVSNRLDRFLAGLDDKSRKK
jgi:hypothetical protein